MSLWCWFGQHDWSVRFNDSPRFRLSSGVAELYWRGGGYDKVICSRCARIQSYDRGEFDLLPELLVPDVVASPGATP